MSGPTIPAKTVVFSASTVLSAIGDELALIKSQDRLTYADLGAILGKSEDQAAKYCAGEADMGLVSFARGKREWNGRFTGALDRLCYASRPGEGCDRSKVNKVLRAAVELSVALEDDDQVDADEVRQNRAVLEAARDALNDMLGKLQPRSAA